MTGRRGQFVFALAAVLVANVLLVIGMRGRMILMFLLAAATVFVWHFWWTGIRGGLRNMGTMYDEARTAEVARIRAEADAHPGNDAVHLLYLAYREGDTERLLSAIRHRETRAAAIRFLGMLGDRRVLDSIIETLEDDDADTRVAAAAALGKIPARRSVASLSHAARNDPELLVRLWSLSSLGRIGEHEATPVILSQLGDPNPRVREVAASALGRFADPSVLPAIEQARRLAPFRRRGSYRAARRSILRRAEPDRNASDGA